MATPLRPRAVPQCLNCLRRSALGGSTDGAAQSSALRQQVRGKKKMVNNSQFVTVRLRKDVKAYGRKGAVIPLSRGEMRNKWFPTRSADYVTMPELKKLRLSNTTIERDFTYGMDEELGRGTPSEQDLPSAIPSMSNEEVVEASAFQKKVPIARLTPERSTELLEQFIRPRLEFYRQPIMEEKKEAEPEPDTPAPEPRKQARFGSGAGAELLAARMGGFVEPKIEKEVEGPQAIYGSVSPLDVLQAVRAALAENDEAKRVVLTEQDVQFVDMPDTEGETAKVVKHVGDFAVEIKAKGAERAVRRVVTVVPQEL